MWCSHAALEASIDEGEVREQQLKQQLSELRAALEAEKQAALADSKSAVSRSSKATDDAVSKALRTAEAASESATATLKDRVAQLTEELQVRLVFWFLIFYVGCPVQGSLSLIAGLH